MYPRKFKKKSWVNGSILKIEEPARGGPPAKCPDEGELLPVKWPDKGRGPPAK
jgi:hypothetical protein